MKKLTVFCSALFALSMSAELLAQTRGPHYNPPSRSGGSSSSGPSHGRPNSSSSSSSSHGSSYHPPSHSSGSSSSSSHGSSYHPPSHSSGSSSSGSTYHGPSYNPPGHSSGSSSSGSTYTGPSYNPPRNNPSYNGNRPVVVGPRYHNPFPNPPGINRYPSPRDYYTQVQRIHIYRRWVLIPVIFTYSNGYWDFDGYPWYVYNGYRHRYDPVETCKYQLVDGNDYTVVKDFGEKECNKAYDECAVERDNMNRPLGLERFFCAEAVDEDQANSNTDEYSPMPNTMDAAKWQTIANYIVSHTIKDIWKDGYNGGVGKCLIYKLRGNEYGCKWIVTVGDEYYPDKEGSVCSETAEKIGCNQNDEKDAVGCILQKAIQEGYCL